MFSQFEIERVAAPNNPTGFVGLSRAARVREREREREQRESREIHHIVRVIHGIDGDSRETTRRRRDDARERERAERERERDIA